ncbi:MAG: hypothetical protein HZB39_16940 [Planctomycetes bacterium]|nr:hypothetical protein [Planctomycetota bacterium]
MSSQAKWCAAALITVLGVCSSIAGLAGPEYPALVSAARWGVLAALALLLVQLTRSAIEWIRRRGNDEPGDRYREEPAGIGADMEQMDTFSRAHIGGGLLNLTHKRAIQRRRPCYFVLWEVKDSGRKQSRELVGYYGLYPLIPGPMRESPEGRTAKEMLDLEEFNATQFRAHHVTTGRDFEVLYIGGVAALPRARYHVTKCLRRRLQRYLAIARESGRDFVRVYTRPTTKDGLSAVTNARVPFRCVGNRPPLDGELGRVMVRVFNTDPERQRE